MQSGWSCGIAARSHKKAASVLSVLEDRELSDFKLSQSISLRGHYLVSLLNMPQPGLLITATDTGAFRRVLSSKTTHNSQDKIVLPDTRYASIC